ncbi:MAG: hypothetical protein CBC91_05755 [Rickettsiales bacterium TMED131]|nr:MAG: hypothetical protein CBC91_05755 [Rickettsiales bacterium TMED131]
MFQEAIRSAQSAKHCPFTCDAIGGVSDACFGNSRNEFGNSQYSPRIPGRAVKAQSSNCRKGNVHSQSRMSTAQPVRRGKVQEHSLRGKGDQS